MWGNLCAICQRLPHGFGWFDPTLRRGSMERRASYQRFCSKRCQDLYFNKLHQGGETMKWNDMEQQAIEFTLGPLGDYVVRVGMDKGLGHYSRDEILGLVTSVLNSYHQNLHELYQDEVPV